MVKKTSFFSWTSVISLNTHHWNLFKNSDNLVEACFYKMVKEKSGVTELPFKILSFFKLKYSKIVILVNIDVQ